MQLLETFFLIVCLALPQRLLAFTLNHHAPSSLYTKPYRTNFRLKSTISPITTASASDEDRPDTNNDSKIPTGIPYDDMTIGVLSDGHFSKEEQRVAITPDTAEKLVEAGKEVRNNFTYFSCHLLPPPLSNPFTPPFAPPQASR